MLSYSVRAALPKVYDMLGEHEKAERMADSLPSLGQSREIVKQHIAATPKERIDAQFSALNRWVDLLDRALEFFSSNGESPLSEEERWEVLKKRKALQELLYDGDIRETRLNLMMAVELAKGYARRGMWDEAMAQLRKAVENSIWRDEVHYNEGYTYTTEALPFRYAGRHTVCVVSTDPVIYRQQMASHLSDAAFDGLRKSKEYGPEFDKLTAMLA